MLIKNIASVNLIVTYALTFEDAAENHTLTCKQGDKVIIRFKQNDEILEVTGVIKQITVTMPLESDTNPVLVVDASSECNSKLYTIKSSEILNISAPVIS